MTFAKLSGDVQYTVHRRTFPRDDPAEREEIEALRAEAFASEDAVEARNAMREKRPPRWKGR